MSLAILYIAAGSQAKNTLSKMLSQELNGSVVLTASYEKILDSTENLATILSWIVILLAIVVFCVMYLASRKVMTTIWQKANFDSITGLLNRGLFVDRFLIVNTA